MARNAEAAHVESDADTVLDAAELEVTLPSPPTFHGDHHLALTLGSTASALLQPALKRQRFLRSPRAGGCDGAAEKWRAFSASYAPDSVDVTMTSSRSTAGLLVGAPFALHPTFRARETSRRAAVRDRAQP
jgi:hypothetical protein